MTEWNPVPLLILGAVVVAITVVFGFGLTFGQRCEKMGFTKNSWEWAECVKRLDQE